MNVDIKAFAHNGGNMKKILIAVILLCLLFIASCNTGENTDTTVTTDTETIQDVTTSVTTDKVTTEEVTSGEVTTEEVTTEEITTEEITTEEITTEEVTTEEVTTEEITTEEVTTEEITTEEVTTEEPATNHPDANMDLTFSKTGDGKGYSVIDLGKCKDTTVVIPAYYNDLPVIKIESNAFEGEEKIESVFIPDTVTAIGSSAFDSCFALTKITFSSKLEAIGDGAFADCGALNSVALPKSLTQVGTGVFAGCHSLQNITMDGEGAYKTEGACLIEVATDTVVAGCRRSTIPEGIKVIGEGAFARIMMLSKINVPASVEKIEKDAFSGCAMLKSIYYAGNEAGWLAIDKETDWNKGAGSYMLYFE